MKKNHLAQFLHNKRLAAGLSQGNVSKALGYNSPQFVSNWERGLSSPPAKSLQKIIRLYKLNSTELIEIILEDTKSKLMASLKGAKRKS